MCSEKSESVDWPLTFVALNLNLVNNSQLHFHADAILSDLCVLHSHVYGVWLQRSIAKIITAVLLHAVIVLSDDVRSRRRAVAPRHGLLVSRRTRGSSVA